MLSKYDKKYLKDVKTNVLITSTLVTDSDHPVGVAFS
jgi:hypothetical protein